MTRSQHDESARDNAAATTSPDIVLTAFAQLGALRLNARHAMISLFDRHHQHILAEATRTLSLQDDHVHQEGDALWLGCTIISKDESICQYTARLPREDFNEESQTVVTQSAVVIPDLRDDDRFKDKSFVCGAPHMKFYAGVPIISPNGLTIGSYCILDDNPRESLDETSLRFLKDMATTVMNHLDLTNSREQHRRGQHMIAGIGAFLRGNMPHSSKRHLVRAAARRDSSRDSERANIPHGRSERTLVRVKDRVPEAFPPAELDTAIESSSATNSIGRGTAASKPVEDPHEHTSDEEFRLVFDSKSQTAPTRHIPVKSDLQEDMLSTSVKITFQRAADIICETVESEGAVFFDGSTGSYGGLVNHASGDQSQSESMSPQASSSSESEEGAQSPPSSISPNDNRADLGEDKKCQILGSANSDVGIGGDAKEAGWDLREQFLKHLQRRYPQGKVFSFDVSGTALTSESTDENSSVTVGVTGGNPRFSGPKKRHRKGKGRPLTLEKDAEKLTKIFPGARSIVFYPMWDARQNRWFSAFFAWTTKSTHMFTAWADLTYIHTFCNSIMMEVHRLDIEKETQVKSNLVSSISHELRSPLHGILGSAELLSDTSMDAFQHGAVHTIESCGRTLLDIVNHLLDFSKINKFEKHRRSSLKRKKRRRDRSNGSSDSSRETGRPSVHSGLINLTTNVELDAVLEEVMDAVFSGHNFYQTSDMRFHALDSAQSDHPGESSLDTTLSGQKGLTLKTSPVTVIFNVDRTVDWIFRTEAGAWRRILMNLFGNSLKYTRSGFISVAISSSPVPHKKPTRESPTRYEKSRFLLTVKDTGQGIGKEFLRTSIFTAFSQENPLTPGSGLGLSIVYQTVMSLGGAIGVHSSKAFGTEITVTVDLPRPSKPAAPNENSFKSVLKQVKELTTGKSVRLLGFEPDSPDDEVSMSLLSNSLEHFGKYCFGMAVDFGSSSHDSTASDFYLVTQKFAEKLESMAEYIFDVDGQVTSPVVIVICPTPDAAHELATSTNHVDLPGNLEYISQPCGPQKLAKAFFSCLKRQNEQLQIAGQVQLQRSPFHLFNHVTQSTETEVVTGVPATNAPAESDDADEKNSRSQTADFSLPIPSRPRKELDDDLADEQFVADTGVSTARPMSDTERVESWTDATELAGRPDVNGSGSVSSQDRGITALLVDDNPINLQLVVAYMKRARFSYSIAANGLDALEAFKSNPGKFQIVITGKNLRI
jgi:signal transduction histidine kinase